MRRLVAVCLCVSVFASSVFAIEYEHVRAGQTYEYDLSFQFTNPRARVLEKRGGKVLIEILEGDRAGEVDWVSPSKLLTSSESQKQETENIVGGLAVGAAIFCALTDSCPKTEEKKSFKQSGNVSAGDRRVLISNNCHKTIELWLAYYRQGKFLGDDVYWTIKPGEKSYLNVKDGSTLYADSNKFLFYARSTDQKLVWEGEREINLAGKRKLPMKTLNVSQDDDRYSAELTCK